MKDDALDDLLKEMTGKEVSVYGEEKTPSPTRSRKDKAPQLKARLQSMDQVNLFDSNQITKHSKSPFLGSNLKRNIKQQSSLE